MNLFKTYICLSLLVFYFNTPGQVNNDNLQNKYRLAKSYEQAGDYDKAASLYAELLSIQPWNTQYVRSLNDIYLMQKEYNKSIELLNGRIKTNPNDISAYGLLGSTYYIIGQNEKAFEIWDRALEINNRSVNNYRIVANFAVENRAFDKAIEILREGQKISNDPHEFSYDLANLYTATLNFKEALNEYCLILKLQPLQLQSIENRIANFFNNDINAEPLIQIVTKWIEKDNLQVHKELLAFIYITDNQYEKGLETIRSLEIESNGNGKMLYNFAQEAFRNKKFSSASRAYELIINGFENSPFEAPAKIGFAKTSEAALDEALKDSHNAWKPFQKADTTNSFRYKPVIEAYNQIAENYRPNNVANEALYRIGVIKFEKMNDVDSAEKILLELAENFPMSVYGVQAKEKLGEIFIRKNQLDKAKQYFEQVANSARGLSELERYAQLMIAKIEFWQQNFSEAVQKFSGLTSNLSDDFSNDAIEMTAIINTTRSDSINLGKYAEADLFAFQNKFDLASSLYKEISEAENSPVLSKFAEYKYAEMLVALDQLSPAIEVLKKITEEEKGRIFSDKSAFLLANIYYYGLNDLEGAEKEYQNILENYPNSLYLDQSREMLNMLQTRKSEKI